MAYTPMKTWGSETLTASDMLTYLTNNIEYLKGVADGLTFSGSEVTRDAATSISDSTDTTITWTAETFDYGGYWSSGTNVVIPAGAIPSGYTTIAVMCLARTKFATNATGRRRLTILKNGSAISGPNVSAINGDETEIDTTRFTTAVAGDIFTVNVYQSSGGALNVSGTLLSVVRFLPAA